MKVSVCGQFRDSLNKPSWLQSLLVQYSFLSLAIQDQVNSVLTVTMLSGGRWALGRREGT